MFLHQSVKKSILLLLEDLGTPRALTVSLLIRNEEWDQLACLEVDPHDYDSPFEYWADAQATAILKKMAELPTSFDRKAEAKRVFFESEKSCFRANERLNPYLDGLACPGDGRLVEFIHKARKIVAQILGPCPTLLEGRFGPGSTFADRGPLSTVPDKISSSPTFTRDFIPFLIQWTGTAWARACAVSRIGPQRIEGNRFLTVPKDARKDRGIAVEPSLNLFYQLAYGRLIRRRLRCRGIDLDFGQDTHRKLAMQSSNDGRLATIDLSSASDTVCKNLVKLLLPPSWFEWLDCLRSKKTLVDGSWYYLEKFSSMGNGFTFELETLLFLALVSACTDSGIDAVGSEVFVYGDDIIFPAEISEVVIPMLNFFGLTVNLRKSFVAGPFRESCGGDFFKGEAVRPYFLKENPLEPHQIISFVNGLRRSANQHVGRSFVIRRAWNEGLNALPSHIRRLRGPEALGDSVIHDEKDRWVCSRRFGIRYIRVWKPAKLRFVSWAHFRPDVVLATALYGVGDGALGVLPRDSVLGYKEGWSAYS